MTQTVKLPRFCMITCLLGGSVLATAVTSIGCSKRESPPTPKFEFQFKNGDQLSWKSFNIDDYRPAAVPDVVNKWMKDVKSISAVESNNEKAMADATNKEVSAGISGGNFPSCVEVLNVARSSDTEAIVTLAYAKSLQIAGPLADDADIFPFSIRSATGFSSINVELSFERDGQVTTIKSIDEIVSAIENLLWDKIIVQGVIINGKPTTLIERFNPLAPIKSAVIRDRFGNTVTCGLRGTAYAVTFSKHTDGSWRITNVQSEQSSSQ